MLSLKEIQEKLKSRDLKSLDLVNTYLEKIEKEDPEVGAFLTVFSDSAREQAAAIDLDYDKGIELGPLAGIPIAVKDNIHIKGQKTTCASKILEGFTAPFDSTVSEKLKEAQLIPIGKVNMDEFAMGSSTEHSAYKVTRNPWDLDRVPGGSSGGSAASVAAGFAPISLGSDTGGSIRQPASFCGVVGLKPTYGRVSRYGLVAFASSLDQIGPFGRTVGDVASLLNVISGHDPKDSTSEVQEVPDFTVGLDHDISGLKIGIPKLLLSDDINDDVKESVTTALDRLKERGATWEPFSFGHFDDALSAYYILAPAEASANLERYEGVRYGHRDSDAGYLRTMYKQTRGHGFGSEVTRRIILGTFVLSSGYYDAYYLKAQKVRSLIINQFNEAFSKFDVLATPTAPTTAFKVGELLEDPMAMYLADIATIPVNLAGLPGVSIPNGFSKEGLPFGLQLIGKRFDEASILRVGHHYQDLTDFHKQEAF